MEVKGQKILIVEDEDNLRELLTKLLMLEGFEVFSAPDVTTGLGILEKQTLSLVITDVQLPDTNGLEFTKLIKSQYPLTEVIVLTAFGNIKDGVKAMKMGAFDYLTKGDGDEKLPLVAAKAVEKAVLNRQLQEFEYRLESKSSFSKIIGQSTALHKTIDLAKKVAITDTTVLLLGETGTGKELMAEAIHLASRRRKGPFIAINCAAIPKDLQESELFGHKKGAFTGAHQDKKGYFEVADRGTIFLDELGEMSPELQAKLLRVLENKTINKVGETSSIPIDVRIIAATNRDLFREDNEEFRKDLYYRLSTFTINLPPLRERKDDIELLALNFMKQNAEKFGKILDGMSSEYTGYLRSYTWPGNIRELRNVVERSVILADDHQLNHTTLPGEILEGAPSGATPDEMGSVDLYSVEKIHILKVLEMTGGNKAEAAKRLDIGLATLYRKLKEYGIDKEK
ncbi:MAG: sigma-54 dependent transcriptional regulator [Bacteroidota bacterium]